jgi:hypothetical protein
MAGASSPSEPTASISVAVVAICSASHLERCLEALERQQGAPDFEIVVACDPHIAGLADVRVRHPAARLFANEGQRTPLELASRALAESRGDVILLTEDHCVPDADWVARMRSAQAPGRAVVGGLVDIAPGASAVDWAFYFVDFFRYASPVSQGPSPTLTVCNASYKRRELEAVAPLWQRYFHETAINDALRERFGTLWLDPASRVTMSRHVELGDALYERYAFGRLFACTRLGFVPRKRLYYCLFSPALPLMLMTRMARSAWRDGALARAFVRSLVPLTLMVLWWSWGEWLGYITGRHPRSLVVAPEIRAAARRRAE